MLHVLLFLTLELEGVINFSHTTRCHISEVRCPANLKFNIVDNREAYRFLDICEGNEMGTRSAGLTVRFACDMFITIICVTQVYGPAVATRVATRISFHTSRHCSLSGTRQGEGSCNLGSSRHVATRLLDLNWPSAVRLVKLGGGRRS